MSKQAGEQVFMDPGSDKPLREEPTFRCVHCSRHFTMQRGSGRVRGFCQNCGGLVCGPGCAECVPVEVMLDNIEQGRPLHYRPIIVPTR